MEWQLLIAVPRQAQRELLCAIYSTNPLVTNIDEATNCKELHDKLVHMPPNFVVIHQSLITDISLLPAGCFVIIAQELDKDTLITAYKHGIRGYFLENPLPLEDLLMTALRMRGGQCLLDPRLTAWALHLVPPVDSVPVTELLSTREQQILVLWNENLSSRSIGEQLDISEGTVKKHLEHIRKKLREHNALELMR